MASPPPVDAPDIPDQCVNLKLGPTPRIVWRRGTDELHLCPALSVILLAPSAALTSGGPFGHQRVRARSNSRSVAAGPNSVISPRSSPPEDGTGRPMSQDERG